MLQRGCRYIILCVYWWCCAFAFFSFLVFLARAFEKTEKIAVDPRERENGERIKKKNGQQKKKRRQKGKCRGWSCASNSLTPPPYTSENPKIEGSLSRGEKVTERVDAQGYTAHGVSRLVLYIYVCGIKMVDWAIFPSFFSLSTSHIIREPFDFSPRNRLLYIYRARLLQKLSINRERHRQYIRKTRGESLEILKAAHSIFPKRLTALSLSLYTYIQGPTRACRSPFIRSFPPCMDTHVSYVVKLFLSLCITRSDLSLSHTLSGHDILEALSYIYSRAEFFRQINTWAIISKEYNRSSRLYNILVCPIVKVSLQQHVETVEEILKKKKKGFQGRRQ